MKLTTIALNKGSSSDNATSNNYYDNDDKEIFLNTPKNIKPYEIRKMKKKVDSTVLFCRFLEIISNNHYLQINDEISKHLQEDSHSQKCFNNIKPENFLSTMESSVKARVNKTSSFCLTKITLSLMHSSIPQQSNKYGFFSSFSIKNLIY